MYTVCGDTCKSELDGMLSLIEINERKYTQVWYHEDDFEIVASHNDAYDRAMSII